MRATAVTAGVMPTAARSRCQPTRLRPVIACSIARDHRAFLQSENAAGCRASTTPSRSSMKPGPTTVSITPSVTRSAPPSSQRLARPYSELCWPSGRRSSSPPIQSLTLPHGLRRRAESRAATAGRAGRTSCRSWSRPTCSSRGSPGCAAALSYCSCRTQRFGDYDEYSSLALSLPLAFAFARWPQSPDQFIRTVISLVLHKLVSTCCRQT
mmetsp:Transcript_8096/g.20772  ORF Transcript_8096/g.20772 Transcript_8096/m.20772 type:complete len:211 (+) Transcript_8096:225-857(+)